MLVAMDRRKPYLLVGDVGEGPFSSRRPGGRWPVALGSLGLLLAISGVLALWQGRVHLLVPGGTTVGATSEVELFGVPPAANTSLEYSSSGVAAVRQLFKQNDTMWYAHNVCISRHFDCQHEFTNNDNALAKHVEHPRVSVESIFSDFMTVRPAGSDDRRLPGTTLLFTVAHLGRFFRWNNIAHFSKRAYPLEDYLEQHGRGELKQVVVWEAARDRLFGKNEGFRTDWYAQLMAAMLPQAVVADGSDLIYSCDDVPQRNAGARPSGSSGSFCFEKLVAFQDPHAPPKDPPFFRHVASCANFRSRVVRWLRLDPLPFRSVSSTVLAVVRTDSQGWSNYPEVVQQMGKFVRRRGGIFQAVYLNESMMTLREQVSWFQRAGVIVTTHGAQEANIAFAHQHATLIEYFKLNHFTHVFSDIAVPCGIRYIGVHAQNTTLCWLRKYMNHHLPGHFQTELKPALGVAMDHAANASSREGVASCQYAHHFVGGGVECYADWSAFARHRCQRRR